MQDLVAYIDPGSGSLIIQALIATAVAVPFFLRHQIGRVIRLVRGNRSATPPTSPTDGSA